MEELVKQEIIDLEKRYWNAMTERDLDTALELTDFPALVAGAHGVYSVSEEEFKKMFENGPEKVKAFELDEDSAKVRQIGPDTAVIAYSVQSELEKDGKSQQCDAVDTSTWVRRDGKWVCALHTETELLRH